jgi:hypothetical protein
MSFWKSLFGGAKGSPAGVAGTPAAPIRTIEHEGYLIEAMPFLDGGQYLVAGTISKEIGGERREHKFIRADRCPTIEDAAEMTLRKGKQIIEQSGERILA